MELILSRRNVQLRSTEEIQKTLHELKHFRPTQLGLTIDSVDECDRYFSYRVIELPSSDNHFHLKYVSFRDTGRYQFLQHILFVKPEIVELRDMLQRWILHSNESGKNLLPEAAG